MGLDAASIGSGVIQRTLRLRMKSLGIIRVEEYKTLLESSKTEWQELVEAVVVTETWFFRDGEPFQAFIRFAREEWLPAHPTRVLRLLCVPCSSGEEPYSILMALHDSGLPVDRFHIDATDISARALARARRGIYSRNSFRGKDLTFRDRHFRPSKDGYVLEPTIRNAGNFFEANLLSPAFLAQQNEPYDAIFCRNLLIYFDRPTQARALQKLEGLLAPSGLLFVGPAEQPLALEQGFVSANIPMAFACRKAGFQPGTSGTEAIARSVLAGARKAPAVRAARFLKLPELPLPRPEAAARELSFLKPLPPSLPLKPKPASLDEARRLADAGKLNEAAAICEAHLQRDGTTAQAWYLLGLVRDADGDPTAADCYRKALYLEPNHYETLLQLTLLAEKSGDLNRARTLRNRAERLKKQEAAER